MHRILGINTLPGIIILTNISIYRTDIIAFQHITGILFIAGSGSIHITDGFKGDFCFAYALVLIIIGICYTTVREELCLNPAGCRNGGKAQFHGVEFNVWTGDTG